MENITNDGKAFRTRWQSAEGSLSESGYEPEDEADKGSHSEEVSRVVTANPRHADKTSDSCRMLRNWMGLGQCSNLNHFIVAVWEIRMQALSLNEVPCTTSP